jgi:hypothetical protein
MHTAMAHWDAALGVEQKAALPRVHGYAPAATRRSADRAWPEFIPNAPGQVHRPARPGWRLETPAPLIL